MSMLEVITHQYRASLKMLENAINACPEPLWMDTSFKNPFWNVAYHALFYTHLYLQPDEPSFQPWVNHHTGSQNMPSDIEPYNREQVLAYLQVCREEVSAKLKLLDLESPSGFHWLTFSKGEVQIYNIRHLQQHIGELCERLGKAGIDIDWVAGDRKD
jgi:hypothetical protein